VAPWLLITAVLATAPTRYLVAIGNNQGAAGEVTLAYAEQDAHRIGEVFERMGGVAAQNRVVTIGADADGVRAVLDDVNKRLAAIPDDVPSALIVYYSGHADAQGLHLGDTTLEYAELERRVRAAPAKVRLLILDGCRSGGLTRVKGARPAEPFAIKIQNNIGVEGVALITSSAAGEDSHESDRLRGSFFTHHLIGALMGAGDADSDGKLTLDEVYRYAYDHTLRSSQRTLTLQHPTHAFDIKGRGTFVLSEIGADARRSGRLVLAEPGVYLVQKGDEDGAVVAELAAEGPSTRVALPAGSYFVQQRGASTYREYRVAVRAGDATQLADLPYEEVAYARLVRKGGGEASTAHVLFALGGVDGESIPGVGLGRSLQLAYGIDLSFASFGLRARWAHRRAETGPGVIVHDEFAVGVSAQRFIDLPVISIGLGLLVEGVHHRQSFETAGSAPDRSAWGMTFGGLVTLEARLFEGLVARIEGGPLTQIFPSAQVEAGAATGEQDTASPFTWTAVGGLGYRF